MKNGFSGTNVVGIALGVALIAFTMGVGAESSGLLSELGGKLNISQQRSNSEANLPEDLDYTSVEAVYDVLREKYEGKLSEEQLLDGLKTGLANASGDPYTVYLNDKQAKAFEESLNGKFDGIGAEIAIKNSQLQVVAPLPNTPAEAAGLRAGDPIIAIDGKDTTGITLEEAVTKIRGKKGTKVVLTIVRDGESVEVPIVRDQIVVPNAESRILPGEIGVIELHTFGDDSSDQVKQIADDFAAQGVKGIILDLRNNSGGLLDSSVDVAGLWLDNQVVVEQRGSGKIDPLRSGPKGPLGGIPTVVLINNGSASASEIVAGALQDHGAAQIVGEQSFGKGSVQSLEQLGGGAQLKVTIARWYTPKGKNIDKGGIKPDVAVKLTNEDFEASRDPQLDAALEILRK